MTRLPGPRRKPRGTIRATRNEGPRSSPKSPGASLRRSPGLHSTIKALIVGEAGRAAVTPICGEPAPPDRSRKSRHQGPPGVSHNNPVVLTFENCLDFRSPTGTVFGLHGDRCTDELRGQHGGIAEVESTPGAAFSWWSRQPESGAAREGEGGGFGRGGGGGGKWNWRISIRAQFALELTREQGAQPSTDVDVVLGAEAVESLAQFGLDAAGPPSVTLPSPAKMIQAS